MCDSEFFEVLGILILCGLIVVLIGMAGYYIGTSGTPIHLNQSVADDVCNHLANTTGMAAKTEGGKLVCEIPSYDSTQNIIIRPAGQNG